MTDLWTARLDAVYADASERTPEELVASVDELCRALEPGDPRIPLERAGVRDYLGREADAIPLYREALESGLDGVDRERAIVQLASSLRNVGQAQEAVDLLRDANFSGALGGAPDAFFALALQSAGQETEALAVALQALAAGLPEYGNAVARYAEDLRGH